VITLSEEQVFKVISSGSLVTVSVTPSPVGGLPPQSTVSAPLEGSPETLMLSAPVNPLMS
jgi:hypothetical protein